MYTRDFKGLLVARMVQCRGGIINEVVFIWLRQKLNEGLDVATWWFIDLVYKMHALFTLITKLKNLILYIYYPMQTNQMFIICNDLVGAKDGFHCLECNMVLKYLLM
jgi:hypothetical protein